VRAADFLLGAAHRLMPKSRRDWADAMRSEVDHIPGHERTSFALGCCWTAIKLRLAPMNTGDFRVSRWVMLVETIGGFGPLTLAWYLTIFGASGLARLDGELIRRVFYTSQGGEFLFAMMLLGAVVGLSGPIGLFLGLRYVMTGRALDNRALGWALVVVPVAANLFGMIGASLWGPEGYTTTSLAFWIYTVMLTWAPAAVVVHLMHLARPAAPIAPRVPLAA